MAVRLDRLDQPWPIGVWVLANWAAVTPTSAAATRATATIARMIFVFISFYLNLSYGLGVVWMLAETDVKRFFETVFSMENGL